MSRATTFELGVLLLCAVATPMHATTITVTNTNDSGPGSLRQALAYANDHDTITFSVTGTIGLTNGELLVNKVITISGPGAASLALDGNGNSRVFHIGSRRPVSISGLTITNGNGASRGRRRNLERSWCVDAQQLRRGFQSHGLSRWWHLQ